MAYSAPPGRSMQPISHGGIRLRRATGAVIGRSAELAAVTETLEEARHGIAGLSLEGEPGIGKSRLLLAAAEIASANGFAPVAVSADEELRGPFMLARGIFSSDVLRDGASPQTIAALDRAARSCRARTTRRWPACRPATAGCE